ncbi:MAG: ATP-binding cassette domain-containing protein [Gammaproteobacteria bacterium]|nr:ATP-binding cassette domain-containing protein [Gammaproteobacteria bacterium]
MPAKHQLLVDNLNFSVLVDSLTSSYSLHAESGDIIGISGTSGVGKSLLLKALADLIPHQGNIQLNNQSQDTIEPYIWRTKVMLVPAESQWWLETVNEHFNILEEHTLSKLNLTKAIKDKQVHQLSTGEKQRLSVLRALEKQPDVLLLDEVSANLDLNNTIALEKVLIEFVQEQQGIIIWVSHDTHQLERICTKCYQMTYEGMF